MPTFKVTMQYYGNAGSGEDSYRCADEREAEEKFAQCRDFIVGSFDGDSFVETIDEPDFFGIINHGDGAWAKVFITRKDE